MDQIKVASAEEEQTLAAASPSEERIRSRGKEAFGGSVVNEIIKKTAAWWVLATGVALFSLLMLILFPLFQRAIEKPTIQNTAVSGCDYRF